MGSGYVFDEDGNDVPPLQLMNSLLLKFVSRMHDSILLYHVVGSMNCQSLMRRREVAAGDYLITMRADASHN